MTDSYAGNSHLNELHISKGKLVYLRQKKMEAIAQAQADIQEMTDKIKEIEAELDGQARIKPSEILAYIEREKLVDLDKVVEKLRKEK